MTMRIMERCRSPEYCFCNPPTRPSRTAIDADAWIIASPEDMDAASAPAQNRPTRIAGISMFISM